MKPSPGFRPYLWWARLIVVLHALLMLFFTSGALSVLFGLHRRYPMGWTWLFWSCVAGMILSDKIVGECILTVWEKQLRERDRPGSAYTCTYMAQYLTFLPTPVLQWGGLVLVVSSLLAGLVWGQIDRNTNKAASTSTQGKVQAANR